MTHQGFENLRQAFPFSEQSHDLCMVRLVQLNPLAVGDVEVDNNDARLAAIFKARDLGEIPMPPAKRSAHELQFESAQLAGQYPLQLRAKA